MYVCVCGFVCVCEVCVCVHLSVRLPLWLFPGFVFVCVPSCVRTTGFEIAKGAKRGKNRVSMDFIWLRRL